MSNDSAVVSASISKDDKEYLKENGISPTRLMKDKISEVRTGEKNPYRYVSETFMKEGRKGGLITMLSGALILVISAILTSFLLVIVSMTDLQFGAIFVTAWGTGCAVAYYGFREYGKWNDVMYWRGRRTKEEKEKE